MVSTTTGTGSGLHTTSVTYAYRANGQVSREDYSDGSSVVVNSWNPLTDQPTSITGRDGSTVVKTYNQKGELISSTGGGQLATTTSSNSATGTSTLTTYKDGNIANTGTTNAATTTWVVDPETGRLTSKTYADNSSISYAYRSDGRLETVTQGSVTATYSYSDNGLSTAVSYAQSGMPTITYRNNVFDAWGNITVASESILYVSGAVTTIQESYAYDPTTHWLTGETFHDADFGDKRLRLAINYYSSGEDVNRQQSVGLIRNSATDNNYAGTLTLAGYEYDAAGRLETITGNDTFLGSPLITAFGYDDAHGGVSPTVTTEITGDDIITTRHYNATNGHLESIVTMRGTTTIYREDNTYAISPSRGDDHLHFGPHSGDPAFIVYLRWRAEPFVAFVNKNDL
jgi:hypothetical protein